MRFRALLSILVLAGLSFLPNYSLGQTSPTFEFPDAKEMDRAAHLFAVNKAKDIEAAVLALQKGEEHPCYETREDIIMDVSRVLTAVIYAQAATPEMRAEMERQLDSAANDELMLRSEDIVESLEERRLDGERLGKVFKPYGRELVEESMARWRISLPAFLETNRADLSRLKNLRKVELFFTLFHTQGSSLVRSEGRFPAVVKVSLPINLLRSQKAMDMVSEEFLTKYKKRWYDFVGW